MILLSLLFLATTNALPSFPATIPNGGNVQVNGTAWPAVGHTTFNPLITGDSSRNPFGAQYGANRGAAEGVWAAICNLDADEDGLTNGEELGDPDCAWRSSADDEILRSEGITHPGFKEGEAPEVGSVEVPVLIKLHSAFMTVAWLVFAPIGIISAVVFKVKVQSAPKWFNWFKVHQLSVGTAVYLTLCAYVFMVKHTGSFLLNQTHTRVGHAVVILAIFQPVSGFYRVHLHKGKKKSVVRLGWEYFHQWTGRLLVALAAVALYFGWDIASFYEEELTVTMKVITILIFVVAAVFCAFWAYFRTDERHSPPLPTKEPKEPKVPEEPKKTVEKTQSASGSMEKTEPEKKTADSAKPEEKSVQKS